MTTIQSSNLPLWLSSDGVLYKQLVCLENYTLKTTTNTNKTVTMCGIALGVGIVEFDLQFSAVCEAAKTATQVTNDDMSGWQLAGTMLYFKIQYPSPGSTSTNIGFSGNVYVTDMSYAVAVNTAVKFTGTLSGTGAITKY